MPPHADRRISRSPLRSRWLIALLGLVLLLAPNLMVLPAYAEGDAELAVTKTVTGWTDGHVVQPGETFDYTITITCTAVDVGTGCTSAQLTDPLPEGLSLNASAADIAITPAGAGTASANGDDITINFTQPLDDPVGGQGIRAGTDIQITIPVQVDDDISPDLDGRNLTNTATADATNAPPDSDSFIVVPNVPTNLAASTDKVFDPDSSVANPGNETTMTLTGGNASNVPVDEIVLTDPTNPPNDAFTYLALNGDLDVTLPAGAEQVQVDCYTGGDWVEGDPSAPPAALPAGVDPADCQGIRVHFISTDGANIAPGASGSIDVGMEQRDNIADAGTGAIGNTVSTTVGRGGDTSDPATASDDYTIESGDIDLDANKTFDPATIAAGSDSRVTIGATNSSSRTLDSMTITEPGADPNMFTDGSNPVTFGGFDNPIQPPSGATGATVTYTYSDGTSETLTADSPNTLPDPDASKTVSGFTVKFTGPIVPGAEASIPFAVTADPDQTVDSLDHPNTVDADSTAPGGYHGHDDADATLTTLKKRIAIDTGKTVLPSRIFSIPGQRVLVQLSAHVEEFPASTTDANDIIVQEPADLDGDTWFDSFAPSGVVNTPIPADSTLTVQYWDGTAWVEVPGMVDLAGPQIFTGDFPDPVPADAQGIRFVYHSDNGFPPGTTVNPNLIFDLKPEAADQNLTIDDCASSSAAADGVDPAQGAPACDDIHIVPPTPGNADFIDKSWDDPAAVGERTQQEKGATIAWSTDGATGIDRMVISDTPDTPPPSQADLPSSVYDSFDLVRIDPISATDDPRLKYDQVLSVELFSASQGRWIDAPGDPCPAACDKTFPGYNLSAASQQDTIAFRLTYAESPTRVVDAPTAPPIGSGVAVSIDNQRHLHPVFRIRDELRSNPDDPVLAEDIYNTADPGVVQNVAQARLVVDDNDDFFHEDAFDDIVITPVNVTADITKDWTGGPMGVPAPGTARFPDQYPTGTVTLRGKNTTPRVVDRLTITEPAGGTDPFEDFNLADFTDITDPATIGATDLTITLQLAGGGTRTLTRDEALAASESDLADVVGFTAVYSGRITSNGTGVIMFTTRLRDGLRSDPDTPVPAPATVDDVATAEAADLVNYPDVDPRTSTDADDAGMQLEGRGIGLQATKTISPDSQTEPDDSPVNVTLSGQPSGPSRTVEMTLTDDDTTFFNAYDFVGFGSFAFTAPIDQVRVDAYVGGTFTAGPGNTVLRTGGTWVTGIPATLALPDGVTADQVQGLRFTFTRADGSIWENPSTPTQPVTFQVQRRTDLRSGGPVLSDLAGNDPMPGEDDPGRSSDTIQGDNYAADTVDGEPLHGHDEATDDILYRHANNAVVVSKTPSGAEPPGANIPYTLTFTNTGAVPITNPVITDSWGSDADGPLLQYDPARAGAGTGYSYALAGAAPDPANGPQLPTGSDPAAVTVAETATRITFTFPAGTVLEVGQTYTITTPLQFRTGLPGNTNVTNTAGISGDRAWDSCAQTLDDDTGECTASTTVYPAKGGALRGVKSVKAAAGDGLGVTNTTNGDQACVPDANGFYVGGCVPVTKPGGDDIWRLTFTNTGNLPQDRVYAIDRLPTPGDTGAITSLTRGSQWTPIPQSISYAGVTGGTVSAVRLYYDTDERLCTADLNLGESCPSVNPGDPNPDGDWVLIGEIANPSLGGSIPIPANAKAIKIEADFFDQMFQPAGTVKVDVTTTAPAQSPTAGPDTIAWNTVAAAARTDDDGTKGLSPKSEGNKVGAALATGPLSILKQVAGPASEHAPTTFDLTVHCTSVGEDVDLGDDASITVTAGEPYEIDDLPWGSECTVSEDDPDAAGNPDFAATTVTVGRDSDEPVQIVATNTYLDASLSIAKDVANSAVDQDGNPITYGPFTFDVSCTFLGQPVYAAGYGPLRPMTATFDSDDPPVVFTELPAGSACTATESDSGGAGSTTYAINGQPAQPGTAADLVLDPDGDGGAVTNTVSFTNTFPTGKVRIAKAVEGEGAELYDVGPFTVHLHCVKADDTGEDGPTTTYDKDFVLGGDQPLGVVVTGLYVTSVCEVTEPRTGGATSSVVEPDGPFQVTADSAESPVVVTVTNTFDVGAIRLIKKLAGGGAGEVPSGTEFTLQLSCQVLVDGEIADVELKDDGLVTLTAPDDLEATYTGLPTGAHCTVTEPDDGGADGVSIEPGEVVVGDGTTVDVIAVNAFEPTPPPPTPPGPPLPNTGGPALGLLVAGLLLAGGGAAAMIEARRRSRG
ncbi:DUF5979 domain-containing protein [Microlunatus ginsengisoli]|uniref:DUF5979 domain-containing protein n=1 Tax=Microlunatus ginsengisoli TaxID=363863 RepID=A0ABP7APJ5_9ACTN